MVVELIKGNSKTNFPVDLIGGKGHGSIKLKNMEKYFKKYNRYVGIEKDIDNMHKCILLLDRIIKDNYYENVFKYYEKKWGAPEMRFIDCNDHKSKKIKIIHSNVITEKDKILCEKEFKILCEKEFTMKQQDIDLLFNIMRKKIFGWWD